jgi:hypothetical protein
MTTTSTATKKKKVVFVCNTCGSEEVLIDAWASWSIDNQRWELFNTFDSTAFCAECDGECSISEKQLTVR